MSGARRVDGWITPLWLSHHYPEDYDRCVRVGRRHVCRRCIVMYPLALVVLALSTIGPGFPGWLTGAASIVLPLPTVVEWVLERRAVLTYDPRRQILLTVPMGIALGMGTVRYFVDHLDPLALIVVAIYGTTCTVSALWATSAADDVSVGGGPQGTR